MKVELEVGNPADPRTTTYKSSSSGWVPVKSGEVKAVVLRSPHILNVNCTQWSEVFSTIRLCNIKSLGLDHEARVSRDMKTCSSALEKTNQ